MTQSILPNNTARAHGLSSINGTLQVGPLRTHEQQREGDSFLVDHLYPYYTTSELKKLNMCRLYMHINTMPDMVGNNRKTIKPGILNGTSPIISSLTWPNIPRPPRTILDPVAKVYQVLPDRRRRHTHSATNQMVHGPTTCPPKILSPH